MARSLALLLSVVALCVSRTSPVRALDADAGVITLNDDNWSDLVMNNGREAWVVSFGADGCAPCAQLAPTFAKAAKHMGGIVNFGHVHVADDTMLIAKSAGLTKIPHVLGYPAHKTLNPYTKKTEKIGVEYRNSTSSHKRIAEFAAGLLPEDRVTRVVDADAFATARADRARRRDETRGASRLYRIPRGGRARGRRSGGHGPARRQGERERR